MVKPYAHEQNKTQNINNQNKQKKYIKNWRPVELQMDIFKKSKYILFITNEVQYNKLRNNRNYNNIREISIDFDGRIKDLPKRINKLTIKYPLVDLPKNISQYKDLKSIVLYSYNKKLPQLPKSLRSLKVHRLDSLYIKEEDDYRFPNNLKYVCLGEIYNEKIPHQLLACPKLKYLNLGFTYNKPLKIPKTLKYLVFGNKFNQPLECVATSALKCLILGDNYNHPLPIFPPTLRKLILYSNNVENINNQYYLEELHIYNMNIINIANVGNNIFTLYIEGPLGLGIFKRNLCPFMIYCIYNKIYIPYEIYNYIFHHFNFYFNSHV